MSAVPTYEFPAEFVDQFLTREITSNGQKYKVYPFDLKNGEIAVFFTNSDPAALIRSGCTIFAKNEQGQYKRVFDVACGSLQEMLQYVGARMTRKPGQFAQVPARPGPHDQLLAMPHCARALLENLGCP